MSTITSALYTNTNAFLRIANNLSDVASASTAATNLGLGTGNTVTFANVVATTKVTCASFQLTTGATNTYLLQSDASGNASWAAQTSITSVGTITSGVWHGTLIAGQYGGTGVANTGLTITLAGGGSGKVLVSDSSGNGTWAALSGIGVTTIQGVANQVLVNGTSGTPTSGVITLTTPQSIGTTSVVQFGTLGVGGVTNALTMAEITSSGLAYSLWLTGTQTGKDGSSQQFGMYYDGQLNPTGGSTASIALSLKPTIIAPSAQTITGAMGQYIALTLSSNVGTISGAYGLYVDNGSSGAGTITAGYGVYIVAPSFGTAKQALYTDNLSVGYTAVTPSVNGAMIKGPASFGISSVASSAQVTINTTLAYGIYMQGTQVSNVSTLQIGYAYRGTMNPTGGALDCFCYSAQPAFIAPSASTITNAASFFASPDLSANVGTITTLYGIWVHPGNANTGTVTTAYGGYIQNPASGTTKVALYTDNLAVGYVNTAPPTLGAIINGPVSLGIATAVTSTQVTINSALSNLIYMYGNQTANLGGIQIGCAYYGGMIPTGGTTSCFSFLAQPVFIAPAATTIVNCACFFAAANPNSNVGTISNLYGIWINAGFSATGTVTNAYGGYFETPGSGSNRAAIFTSNMAVGYAGVTPPSNGVIVMGQLGVGNSAPTASTQATFTSALAYNLLLNGTQTAQSGNAVACLGVQSVLRPTANVGDAFGVYNIGYVIAPTGVTISNAAGYYVYMSPGGNVGTIGSLAGLWVDVGSAGAGTISTAYGILCNTPVCATTNICAYFAGPIQLGTSSTGATTCTLGTNSPAAGTTPNTWLQFIKSDGTLLYVPAWH